MQDPGSNQLHPDRWRHSLTSYWDQQLPDLIKYGFPLDFDRKFPLSSSKTNHTSAVQHKTHVDAYIKEELEHVALYNHIAYLLSRWFDTSDPEQKLTQYVPNFI